VFFEKPEFANQPQKVRDYVYWALKPDGPAYYQVPTPKSCMVDRNHPNYIVSSTVLFWLPYAQLIQISMTHQPPDGFLQSTFITPIAQRFLGYAKNSVLYPVLNAGNPPRGLYSLILTAVSQPFLAPSTPAEELVFRWSERSSHTCKAPTLNLPSLCMTNTGEHFKSSVVMLMA
jgi:hypothetical protein